MKSNEAKVIFADGQFQRPIECFCLMVIRARYGAEEVEFGNLDFNFTFTQLGLNF